MYKCGTGALDESIKASWVFLEGKLEEKMVGESWHEAES